MTFLIYEWVALFAINPIIDAKNTRLEYLHIA